MVALLLVLSQLLLVSLSFVQDSRVVTVKVTVDLDAGFILFTQGLERLESSGEKDADRTCRKFRKVLVVCCCSRMPKESAAFLFTSY